VIEECDPLNLQERENWYLRTYRPLLNSLDESYSYYQPLMKSDLTRLKISQSLLGKTLSSSTKQKMSQSRLGAKNHYWQKSVSKLTLDAAAAVLGKPIYVYKETDLELVNGKPFRSIRDAVKHLPISQSTLPKKLDSNKPFKGFYYYTYAKS
jgi:group I intron endonuclease